MAAAATSKRKLASTHYDHVPRTTTFSLFVPFPCEMARVRAPASAQKDKPYLHINVINLHAAINSFGFGLVWSVVAAQRFLFFDNVLIQ